MKLFLDANVLFTAAHNPHGKASLVIELAREGVGDVVTSSFAVDEARRNIEVKFPKALDRLESLLNVVDVAAAVVGQACPIELPEKDAPIFLSARGAGCTHLLTGDRKHFGKHMNVPDRTSGIIIQTVADLLATAKRSRS